MHVYYRPVKLLPDVHEVPVQRNFFCIFREIQKKIYIKIGCPKAGDGKKIFSIFDIFLFPVKHIPLDPIAMTFSSRPYFYENTRSHSHSEVKHRKGWLVPVSETDWKSQPAEGFLLSDAFKISHWFFCPSQHSIIGPNTQIFERAKLIRNFSKFCEAAATDASWTDLFQV